MTEPVSNPFAEEGKTGLSFAFTAEEAIAVLEAAKTMARSDRRVCKCGHAARFHISESTSQDMRDLAALGHNRCAPGRQVCPCAKFEAVMVVGDVRRFMARTDGPGAKHALAKGAMTTWKIGGKADWIEGVACDLCGAEAVHLTPIAYTERYEEATYPTAHNKLVCTPCRMKLASGLTSE